MSYQDEFDSGYAPRFRDDPAAWRHSGVGIASFVTGIIALLLFIGAIGVVLVAVVSTRHARQPPQALLVPVGLMVIGSGLMALVGTGLGIGGCCQRERKKVFAILGLVINGFLLLAGIGLMLVGLASSRGMANHNLTLVLTLILPL